MKPNEMLWLWLCGLSFLCGMMVCIAIRAMVEEFKKKRDKERAEWHTKIWLNTESQKPITVTLDQWNKAYEETLRQSLSVESLRRIKALVFMRLNAARDAKDKKTIATLTEIQEAMR